MLTLRQDKIRVDALFLFWELLKDPTISPEVHVAEICCCNCADISSVRCQ